jgi:hypothetical protein
MNTKTCLQLALLPMFAVLALGSSSPKKGTGGDKVSTTETTGAVSKEAHFFAGASWTVLDVVDRGSTMKVNDGDGKPASTSGRFIQVHYRVTNTGKKEGSLHRGSSKITDLTGREFGSMAYQEVYIPKGAEPLFLDKIQPSLSKDFYAIVEVPADAQALSLKVSDFGYGSSTRTISLGEIAPPAPSTPAAVSSAKAPATGSTTAAKAAPAPLAAKAKAAPAKPKPLANP